MVEEKGTEYVVLRFSGEDGLVGKDVGRRVADSKEEAIRRLIVETSEGQQAEKCSYRAVPLSSWKDEFVVETEPRVRRKR